MARPNYIKGNLKMKIVSAHLKILVIIFHLPPCPSCYSNWFLSYWLGQVVGGEVPQQLPGYLLSLAVTIVKATRMEG